MQAEQPEKLAQLERHLGWLLVTGVSVSAAALALGLAVEVFDPSSGLSARILAAGLIILMATPMLRVVVSVIEYIRMGEWFFVLTTLVVLAELGASVFYAMRR